MRRSKTKNMDRFLATSAMDKKLAKAQIPPMFWNAKLGDIGFRTVAVGDQKVSATAQRQWVRAFLKHYTRRPPLIVVSSGPTDNGAMNLGCLILTQALKKGKAAAVIDTSLDVPFFEEMPMMVLIHNILDNASLDRKQKARDLILKFRNALKVLVVADTTNPYQWTVKNIRLYPNMVFKVADLKP